jgi:hypothetical protein
MSASDLKWMKEMEAELSRLKRMFANLTLENQAMKDLSEKKALRSPEKREAVRFMIKHRGLSVARSCRCARLGCYAASFIGSLLISSNGTMP